MTAPGWVEVFRVSGDIEANLAAGKLDAAGIEYRLLELPDKATATWLYGGHDPRSPVAIFVMEADGAGAREVLHEHVDPLPSSESEDAGPEEASATGSLTFLRALRWPIGVVVAVLLLLVFLEGALDRILPFL